MVAAIQAALNSARRRSARARRWFQPALRIRRSRLLSPVLCERRRRRSARDDGTLSGNSISGPAVPQVITFVNPLTTAATGTFNLTIDGVTVPVPYPAVASQAAMVAEIQQSLNTAAAPLGPARRWSRREQPRRP